MFQVLSRIGWPLLWVWSHSAPCSSIIVVGGRIVVIRVWRFWPRGTGGRTSSEGRQSNWQSERQRGGTKLRGLHGRHCTQMVQPKGHAHIHAVIHLRWGSLLPPPSTDARLSTLSQATFTISMVGVSWVVVVGWVQDVALVLLGGSWLME